MYEDFSGGAVDKTLCSQCRVQSLVSDLDPTCMLQLRVCMLQLSVCMPQLRRPRAATKTRCNQINKLINILQINTMYGKLLIPFSLISMTLSNFRIASYTFIEVFKNIIFGSQVLIMAILLVHILKIST